MPTFSLGGLIDIADPVVSGVYPLLPTFNVTRKLGNDYVINKISLKKEQRIRKTFGHSGWTIEHQFSDKNEVQALVDFYSTHKNPSLLFYFYDPHETQYLFGFVDLSGASAIGRYVCRFADTTLTHEAFRDHLFRGVVELIEVNESLDPIDIGIGWTYQTQRYPLGTDGGASNLAFYSRSELIGIKDIVPLVWIRPIETTVDTHIITISDRLAHVNQQFGGGYTELTNDYLPRLLDWEIVQESGTGDSARFLMDNADDVWTDYIKQLSLERAAIRFLVYKDTPTGGQGAHEVWAGTITSWSNERNTGVFTIECEGALHGLQRSMPRRTGATVCPWQFNDGQECPYTAQGSGGDPDTCDKGLDTPNGCAAHGMTNYFGGVNPKPQIATGHLTNTGFWGLLQKSYSSTSTPNKSIQGEVIPITYGDGRQIVAAKIFETRDESEFFVGAGFFSEGPIGQVGQVLLDGQTQHPGYSPIVALGNRGQNIGTHIDPAFRSSSTAFVSVRRVDEVGLQPMDNHKLEVEVLKGVPGTDVWWWTGPFALMSDVVTSNPCHIAMNFVLRALGIHRGGTDANYLKDRIIELDRFREAVLFCDAVVPSLVGGGNEHRFEFRGTVDGLKPAIDHLRDILAGTPIDIVYTFGKLAFKVRKDDITIPPATQLAFEHLENIIQGSVVVSRKEVRFNELKILFSDIALDFQENSVTVYDELAQLREGSHFNDTAGGPTKPLVRQTQQNAIGLFSKSQVARLATQLLYEELGGATQQEQLDARTVNLSLPLIGLMTEISDVSLVIHPDLPNGSAYVRWNYWKLGSNWQVDLRGDTVTASMYGTQPPQLPSSSTGDTQPGIPGGSQGSNGSENTPAPLTPPVLTLLSQNYTTAIIGVSPRPPLTSYLVVQVSNNDSFNSGVVETVYGATLQTYPITGTAGVHKWTRAKWRRTSAVVGPPAIPAEESGWSNVIELTFPKIVGTDIAGLPESACLEPPAVPVIQASYGWTEFIEISLLGGNTKEGAIVWFAGTLTSGGNPKAGLGVMNISSDPTIRIERVDYTIGNNSPHCAGFTSLDTDQLDPSPLVTPRQTIAVNTNITTIDATDPGSPKRGVDYFPSLTGTLLPKWVRYVEVPEYPGSATLVCPQDASGPEAEAVPLAYHCKDAWLGARLDLVQFSASERGVARPQMMVQIYARGASPYLTGPGGGRTFFPPFIQHVPFPGTYGSYSGNTAPPFGRFRVRFSTGLVVDREGGVVPGPYMSTNFGLLVLPTNTNLYQLDDFFLFVSTSPFSATLDSISGFWQDALDTLPAGVYLVFLGRTSNFMASNYLGNKLLPGTSYYFRVGARRPFSFCQKEPDYFYSATLSAQETQRLGTTSGTDGGGVSDPGLAPVVGPVPGNPFSIVEGSGINIVIDETARTIAIGLDTARVRESSGYLFVVNGDIIIETNACHFQITADFAGKFKDWVVKAFTAPTGANVIVDIHKNGTSIFADGVNRPVLPAGQTSATGQAFNIPDFVQGDVFRMDIDQIGSGTPGENVEIQLNFDSPLRILT